MDLTQQYLLTKRSQYIIGPICPQTNDMSNIPTSTFDQDFKFQRLLGKGNYATVSEVYHVLDKKKYAVKQIMVDSIEELAQALNEIEVLKILEDQHATKIFYHFIRSMKKPGHYEIGIVMELCETSLTELIKQRKKKNNFFSAEEVRHFIASLVPFFAKMQKRGYIHRDIKPDNILVNRGKEIDYRVADFGFAIKINNYSGRNVAGTMQYVSPKLLVKFKNQKISVSGQNFKDDVFSLGKTLTQLMTLQIGQPFIPQKLIQCRSRYGDQLCCFIERMLAQNQQRRADFISLQSYINGDRVIERTLKVQVKTEAKNSKSKGKNTYASGKTTPKAHLKNFNDSTTTECSTFKESKHKIRPKANSIDSKIVKVENSLEQPKNIKVQGQSIEPTTKAKTTNWIEKNIKMKEQVYCMGLCDTTLFLGLGNKIGMMIIATQRLMMLLTSESIKKITCLHVSQDQETLYVGGLSGKLLCLPICELNKLIIQNQKSFKINNTLQISLNTLIFRQISLEAPIACLFTHTESNFSSASLLVGHLTGEISVISNNKVQRKIYFSTEPITCISLRDQYLYSSSAHGTFKREKAFSIGITLKNNIEMKPPPSSNFNYPYIYRCSSPILTFEIISSCKANKAFTKDSRKYLAILVEFDGYIHILSNSMKCQRLICISEDSILSAWFKVDVDRHFGVEGLFVNEQGVLLNEKEEVVTKLGRKGLGCLCASRETIFCGGFEKNLVILGPNEDTIDLQ